MRMRTCMFATWLAHVTRALPSRSGLPGMALRQRAFIRTWQSVRAPNLAPQTPLSFLLPHTQRFSRNSSQDAAHAIEDDALRAQQPQEAPDSGHGSVGSQDGDGGGPLQRPQHQRSPYTPWLQRLTSLATERKYVVGTYAQA